ncbi:MAG TPA: MFS transporter [Vicinamibacterales bacterium]|nr:MFS transporter [Vicinamibacterales bacterium]
MIDDAREAAAVARVTRRLVPLLVVCMIAAFLDRVNVSFAALTMNADLGLSASAYAFGAGIFFLTYFIFEIPSNLLLERVGARVWIARIMFTWGLLSAATAFVTGPRSFYAVRALLGAAEAGFFPGIIFYLTLWFPEIYRARIVGYFMTSVPLATVIGAPISGAVLGLNGFVGLKGWQWLFLLEAVPSLVLSIVVFLRLTDTPQQAAWLDRSEREWLVERLDRERRAREAQRQPTVLQSLVDPTVLLLSAVYFCIVAANYGLTFFVPLIVKAFGFSNLQTGFVSAIPYALGTMAMVIWARRSDRSGERRLHTVVPLLAIATGLVAAAASTQAIVTLAAFSFAAVGVFAAFPVFWTLPTVSFSGAAAAGAIALINSIGNLSGFAGPYAMGWFKDRTGTYAGGLLVLSALAVAAAIATSIAARPGKAAA